MPNPYDGNAVYPETLNLPSDGDPPTGSSVNPALEGLADRTTYIKERLHLVAVEQFTHEDPGDWATFTTESFVEEEDTEIVFDGGLTAGDFILIDGFLQGGLDFGPVPTVAPYLPAGIGELRLVYQVDEGSGFGSKTVVPGCYATGLNQEPPGPFDHVTFASCLVVPANAAAIRFVLEGRVDDDEFHLGLYSGATIRCTHFGREVT